MDQKEQFDSFLMKYETWIDDNVRTGLYADRALLMLLKRFKDEMPPIDSPCFHKASGFPAFLFAGGGWLTCPVVSG